MELITDFQSCPLCFNKQTQLFYRSTRVNLERDYLSCHVCSLIFVPSMYHLSPSDELDRYLEHNNDVQDIDYRKFLSPMVNEVVPRIGDKMVGLDYGAGPGPALAMMLEDLGHEMHLYDKYFYPHQIVLEKKYDFIVCTETVEHFSNPFHDFDTIYSLILQGGLFGIMTSILYDDINFADWYYRLDPTHVAFYRPKTMDWISQRWNWDLSVPLRNVCIFKKNIDGSCD